MLGLRLGLWLGLALGLGLSLSNAPIQKALVYILFCVARKKSDNGALGHDSID